MDNKWQEVSFVFVQDMLLYNKVNTEKMRKDSSSLLYKEYKGERRDVQHTGL